MGLFDQARKLAEEHAEQVTGAIEKAADLIDDKTGRRYSAQIDKGASTAKGFVAGDGEHEPVAGDGEHEPVAGDGEHEPVAGDGEPAPGPDTP